MDPIRVLLTGLGCPGGFPTLRALKREGAYVVATDLATGCVAASVADAFHVVPPGEKSGYLWAITELIAHYNINVVLPQTDSETLALAGLSPIRGAVIMGPTSPGAVRTCLNKAAMYERFVGIIPIPEHVVCESAKTLMRALTRWQPAVIKPLAEAGSRGFRIVVPAVNRLRLDWRQWPAVAGISLSEAICAMHDAPYPLMAMEYLGEGPEYAVNVYCRAGEVLLHQLVRRQRGRIHGWGTTNWLDEDDVLLGYTRVIARALEWDGFLNTQFMGGKLLEVNPRLSTLICTPEFNMPWLAVQYAAGRISKAELWAASSLTEGEWYGKWYVELWCDTPVS